MEPTQWDEDRILARVEARQPSVAGQTEIGAAVGYVVRVYDKGPSGDRLGKPALIFCSEQVHGSLGVLGSEEEAQDYCDRRRDVTLQAERDRERLAAERERALPGKSEALILARERAKDEAKAANKRAKEHQQTIDDLIEEAGHPSIAVECPIHGTGWAVMAAPSISDGTLGQEPRVLTSTRPEATPAPETSRRRHGPRAAKAAPAVATPEIDASLDATPDKPPKAAKAGARNRGKADQTPQAPKIPPHVPDTSGFPLKVGTRVEHQGDTQSHHHSFEARVTKIVRYDNQAWIVEIEGVDDGLPRECASTELVKLDARDPHEDEPEPEDE